LSIEQGGFAVRLLGRRMGWHADLPEQAWSGQGELA
jgi:hypothetical protein